MGRDLVRPQPDVQQPVRLREDRHGEGQDHEPGVFDALADEFEAIVAVLRRPGLGHLRVERRQEIGHELLDDALDLQGDAARGIDRHAEEEVGDLVDALRVEDVGARAEEAPARERGHLAQQRAVPDQAAAGFGEMAAAVEAVGETHEHGHREHQHGITDQLVEGRYIQQQRHAQLERRLAETDHGEGRHPLARDDGGVVGDGQQVHHQHAQRALEHPARGIHPPFRDDQPVAEPPRADRLHEQHQQQAEAQLDDDAGGENAAQAGAVALAQTDGQIAADRRGNRGREEGEHGHHPTHDVIDTIVIDTQRPEHHTRGEQADEHQQEHAEIQQEGIPCEPLAVLRKLSCSRRHGIIRLRPLRPAPP